jgi:hypothetical protein
LAPIEMDRFMDGNIWHSLGPLQMTMSLR